MSDEADAFVAELKRWRDVRGLSQSKLAQAMGYDRSYISKIESGTERPNSAFAKRADEVLQAGGAVRRALQAAGPRRAEAGPPQSAIEPTDSTASLIVEHDDAELIYQDGMYRPVMRRRLFNGGTEPVARYMVRISVDRYPGDPDRSNELYRNDPLTWEELQLEAWCGDEPMLWKVRHDRDAFKEVWMLFENADARFPLYPGESAEITYAYNVSETKWGHWFQRAVRLPTKRLSVRLDFPSAMQPSAWGMETSMTAEALPFRAPIQRTVEDDRVRFAWATEDPPLHARYRLEWRFKAESIKAREAQNAPMAPSEQMTELGIVQDGDDILRQNAKPFDLPAEAEDARRVVAELQSAMERVASVHVFGKGMGVAAPQIGIGRAAAIVRTPDGELITLLNPHVIDEAVEQDQQYEGCLSFFDVRGKVPRPLAIQVEHTDIDGQTRITNFQHGVARLVAHEVDHLHGMLYTDRMEPGVSPISVEQYRGTGQSWQYR
ncbi:peptide deformylase [Lentzea atacamensis]|uniref:Peptide deformylase n=1 Tax=Lentzea atacamensis TaxID=531938 RepID=A0A316ICQ3_9PSEU|nr:peptide deformylase [Lentzea atacamensis]PWK90316.1 peptide deformylase [Lentzea atacamensis]